MHTARVNPSIPERVTLTYAVAQQDTLLTALQVERAVDSLSRQDAALELDYPVVVAAQGSLYICVCV